MRVFINKNGDKFGFDEVKEETIQPDWVECFPNDDGEFYDSYNIDGTPDLDYVVKQDIPESITPLQAKLQLLEMGLLGEVDTLVANDRKVQLYWEYALSIERYNDILLSMATQLGLTDEQLDNMFIEASKL